MNKDIDEDDVTGIMEEIAKVWQETKDHFGDAFPFEDELPFIFKKEVQVEGKIDGDKIKVEKENDK